MHVSKAFYFDAAGLSFFFWYAYSDLLGDLTALRQEYPNSLVPGLTRKSNSDVAPERISAKIFDPNNPTFETKQLVWDLKGILSTLLTGLFPHIWRKTFHNSENYRLRRLKNEPQKVTPH